MQPSIRTVSVKLVSLVKNILDKFGYAIISSEKLEILRRNELVSLVNRWGTNETSIDLQDFIIRNHGQSYSQLQQDLFALYTYTQKNHGHSERGFFVEFGATDGILRSNTYLLETRYHWKGILCEPARTYNESLRLNRSATIDYRCVYSISGETLEFHEVNSSELSGIKEFQHIGGWERERSLFTPYSVNTVSLDDLLVENNAPNTIDYISIDTEGSEYEILRNFPFDKWKIGLFSIEHNYSENESKIDDLMLANGYSRVLKDASEFDAWYVRCG